MSARQVSQLAGNSLIGAVLGPIVTGAISNLYSQGKQRQLYAYQRGGYERQLADYRKNVGRPIKYPEFSYPGHIRALDAGISQSYSSSFGTIAGAVKSIGMAGFPAGRSLYSKSTGRTSRYL